MLLAQLPVWPVDRGLQAACEAWSLSLSFEGEGDGGFDTTANGNALPTAMRAATL